MTLEDWGLKKCLLNSMFLSTHPVPNYKRTKAGCPSIDLGLHYSIQEFFVCFFWLLPIRFDIICLYFKYFSTKKKRTNFHMLSLKRLKCSKNNNPNTVYNDKYTSAWGQTFPAKRDSNYGRKICIWFFVLPFLSVDYLFLFFSFFALREL